MLCDYLVYLLLEADLFSANVPILPEMSAQEQIPITDFRVLEVGAGTGLCSIFFAQVYQRTRYPIKIFTTGLGLDSFF